MNFGAFSFSITFSGNKYALIINIYCDWIKAMLLIEYILTVKERNCNYHQNSLELFNIFWHLFYLKQNKNPIPSCWAFKNLRSLGIINIKENPKTLRNDSVLSVLSYQKNMISRKKWKQINNAKLMKINIKNYFLQPTIQLEFQILFQSFLPGQ